VNWQSCWSRFKYGRGPSGHFPAHSVNQRQKDTIGRSSRRHGVRTAKLTSRRHNPKISGTCGACNTPQPITQSPPWGFGAPGGPETDESGTDRQTITAKSMVGP
jgi:hypothetical protein